MADVIRDLTKRLTDIHRLGPDPSADQDVVLMVHSLPKGASWESFIKGHLARVQFQAQLAATLPFVAMPVVAGVEPTSAQFTCAVIISKGAVPFTSIRTPRHALYAALEKAIESVWASGVEFTRLEPTTIFIHDPLEVRLLDFSSIVAMQRWKANLLKRGSPHQSMFAGFDGPDVELLRKVYGRLAPAGDPVRRGELVELARGGLANMAQSIS